MMRQMREATKPIMLFTAIAFVALMVFQWGMDITGQSGGGLGEIGSVNGDAVMYESYMSAYRQLYDQVQRSQEELISSQQNTEIEDAAFDEVVNQLLILQELERRGITVTDREISDAAQFNPPEYLRPQFTNDAGGLDNVTVVVIDIEERPFEQASPGRRRAARLLWLVSALLVVAAIAFGVYSYARSQAYVIEEGGGQPNVVPDRASNWYYIRAPTRPGPAV